MVYQMTQQFFIRFVTFTFSCVLLFPAAVAAAEKVTQERLNILWIVVEDASPHIGCYGETTINTPALDALAAEGIRFDNAFVTCPVCSPCRSALVTGMYQTTLGTHNHRSQCSSGKGKGGPDYIHSYRLPVPTVARLFKDAGYFTCNSSSGLPDAKRGKTDYNFVWDSGDYDAADWKDRDEGQPFFAQVQLHGGKNRKAHEHATDPSQVNLPPYYPDHPVVRKDWAEYLNSWVQTDREVAAILERLDDEGIAESTAVFFLTDHGISHLRGKQFLYEEGIRVPLIVRLPGNEYAGTFRRDLVTQIDLAATSLALAGIAQPDHLQGLNLFADKYVPREFVVSARDRCDETVDIIRCVRTKRFKYIRNFMPHLPYAQPNQYKDGKQFIKVMRELYADDKLSEFQSRPFLPNRPAEELYDLDSDPHEQINLADVDAHRGTLQELRRTLYDWMESTGDLGVIPEPILEDMGRDAGNKYKLLRTPEQRSLIPEILRALDTSHFGGTESLTTELSHDHAAVRYWAATAVGLNDNSSLARHLMPLLADESSGVCVAAALAHCRLARNKSDVSRLAGMIPNANYITGMYAIRALEQLGPDVSAPQAAAVDEARDSPYEFTRRIARRLSSSFSAGER